MKKPIEEDYRYSTTGNASSIDYAEYSSDLELYIKHMEEKHNNDIHSVSVSSGVSDLDFKAACHWYNMVLSHIETGKDDMSVVDEITKQLKANFKRR